MRENETENTIKKKTRRAGHWLYRHGVVFSAAMMVLSLFADLGAHLANKLGMNKAETSTAENKNHLQPYEKPSFHIFSSVIKEANAMSIINIMT